MVYHFLCILYEVQEIRYYCAYAFQAYNSYEFSFILKASWPTQQSANRRSVYIAQSRKIPPQYTEHKTLSPRTRLEGTRYLLLRKQIQHNADVRIEQLQILWLKISAAKQNLYLSRAAATESMAGTKGILPIRQGRPL